jgi:hypothetical protein
MEIKKELITPEIAKKLLEKNDHNRRLKIPVYLRYAEDIKNGRWKDNTAELIKISESGLLLDGQHRLKAVLVANQSVFFWVAYGLKDSVFDVLDTGAVRSSSDTFKVAQIKNANQIPSIINSFFILKKSYQKSVQKNEKLTNSQILEEYYKDADFWQYIFRMSSSWYESFSKIIPVSTIGAMFATFYHINKEDAIDFMNQLCKGSNIKNPTIELLRKRLIQDRLSNAKISPTLKNVLIVKVWNFYRKNESVKVLKFDFEKEEFPRPL